MKKLLFILIIFVLLNVLCPRVYTKDIELILYKDFLEELIKNVFPVSFSKTYTPDIPVPEISNALSFDYQIIIHKPALSIHPQYIQVDVTTDWLSPLGKQSFPGKFKFLPVFNPANNQLEFKVTEGTFNLKIDTDNTILDLGDVDISPYISNIKIPLEFNNINVSDTTIKPQCQDVTFQLLEDKIIMNSEIIIKKE